MLPEGPGCDFVCLQSHLDADFDLRTLTSGILQQCIYHASAGILITECQMALLNDISCRNDYSAVHVLRVRR